MMLCERCGKQKADHTTHPAGVCECHRVRIDIEPGAHMDITLTGDETPETMEALQALGRAVLARERSSPADSGGLPESDLPTIDDITGIGRLGDDE